MKCPHCHAEDTRVIDTRVMDEGAAIRRRRECEKCEFRFTTREEMEILSLTVIKNDGSEQQYSKEKLVRSLELPLYKRSLTQARFRKAIHAIEQEIQSKAKGDTITSAQIGEIVMQHLRRTDKVAYIRFAAVYQSFEDLDEFRDELQKLTPKRKKRTKKKK